MSKSLIYSLVAILTGSIVLNVVFYYKRLQQTKLAELSSRRSTQIAEQTRLARVHILSEIPVARSEVVFTGTSLTEGLPVQLLSDKAKNKGVSGGTIAEISAIIKDLESDKPSKIFIEVGINDLKNGMTEEDLIVKMGDLIKSINLPDSSIHVSSVFPVNEIYFDQMTDSMTGKITRVNKALRDICAARRCTFIDVFSEIAENDKLPSSYSPDGLHLNEHGYHIWMKKLRTYINP